MGDTETTWTTMSCLGLVPHFHGDPVEGGAPLASADGHWWWDGTHWTPVHLPGPVAAETAAGTAQPTPAWARAS
jgi:hypothetical protein